MTKESLTVQLKGLQTQLAVLEAQVEEAGTAGTSPTFASLQGLLSRSPASLESEIAAAKFSIAPAEESRP